MNPPYGRTTGLWMEKAYTSSLQGATAVCLVPARSDTKWWHEYAMKGRIEFIRGELKFGAHLKFGPVPRRCGGVRMTKRFMYSVAGCELWASIHHHQIITAGKNAKDAIDKPRRQ
jgi:hypothetical protein